MGARPSQAQSRAPLSAVIPWSKDIAMRVIVTVFATVISLAAPAAAQPQTLTSAEAVKALSAFLTSHNQTAIAARDPESGAFIAALFYPGSQMLVVSAK